MIAATLAGGRGWLDAPAAASLARVDAALGRLLDINEAGRTGEQQQAFRDAYERGEGAFALPRGQSIHEVGRAIDTDDWTTPGVIALLESHGWIRTALGRGEPWHCEYDIARDQHLTDPTPTPLTNGDDLMKLIRNTKDGGCYIVGPRRLKHIGNMTDLARAEKTFGRTIDLDDASFRVALIGFDVPYDKAKKNADYRA